MPYRRADGVAGIALSLLLSVVPGCGSSADSPDSSPSASDSNHAGPVTTTDLGLLEIHHQPPDVPAVNPFRQADNSPVVLLFIRQDCPISNRYAPEFGRILDQFQAGVRFWVVYPDPALEPDEIRSHLRDYDFRCDALWDSEHRLVNLTGATVTPEVAVYDSAHRLVYRGRIDDRFVDFGKARPEPSQRDLQEALESVLSGSSGPLRTTTAIGCPISDLKH